MKLPKTNDLVSRLVTPIANRYHLRTFGSQTIQGLVREATAPSAAEEGDVGWRIGGRNPDGGPRLAARGNLSGGEDEGVEGDSDEDEANDPIGRGWSREEASAVNMGTASTSGSAMMTPVEGRAFSQLAMSPSSSHHQLYSPPVISAMSTPASVVINPTTFLSPSPHDPPPIHLFTRSIVDVLSAWVNRLDPSPSTSTSASSGSAPFPHQQQLTNPLHRNNFSDENQRKRVVQGWVETVAPFVVCLRLEAGVYWGWGRWKEMMDEYNELYPLPTRLARFMFLFRSTLPDLYVRP